MLNLNQRDRDFYEETKDEARIYLACAMCQVNLISFKPYRHTHTHTNYVNLEIRELLDIVSLILVDSVA